MQPSENVSPVNPLPPLVVALFLIIMGIEAIFTLGAMGYVGGPGAVGWRLAALQQYAFVGEILDWMLVTGQYPLEHLIRPVSYLFVHVNFTQALFAGVMVLALGKMVGEVFSAVATLTVFLASGAIGAVAYGVVLNSPAPLIGAFPGAYGLIGAFTFLIWARLRVLGEHQGRAFTLIGFLLGIQLIFGLIFGSTGDWLADVAGFATGFTLSFFLVPGGWARLRAMMRRD